MAKIDNYIAGREDGLQLALNIVKKKGVKGLEDEIRFRNATKIHTLLDKKSLEIATQKIKEMTVDTVTVLSVAVLRDEFEFGKKRCQRYIDRMNLKAECLTEGFVKWNEIVEDIDNDMGIRLRIRRNDRRYGTTL
jgi:hypothetical protein|nr:MAG TPA: hypothetical protein [Caudoviricetes sp.]